MVDVPVETCGVCRFYASSPIADGATPIGICRANPPILVVEGQQNIAVTRFPVIGPDDWCGGFGAIVGS